MSAEKLIKIPKPPLAEWLMEPMRAQQGDLLEGRVGGGVHQHLRPADRTVHDDGLRPRRSQQRDVVAGRAVDRARHRHHLRFHPEDAARLFRRSCRRADRPRHRRERVRAAAGDPARAQERLDRRARRHDARARGAARLLRLGDPDRDRRRAVHPAHPADRLADRRLGGDRPGADGAARHHDRLADPPGARAAVGAGDGRGPAEAVGAGRDDRRARDGQVVRRRAPALQALAARRSSSIRTARCASAWSPRSESPSRPRPAPFPMPAWSSSEST